MKCGDCKLLVGVFYGEGFCEKYFCPRRTDACACKNFVSKVEWLATEEQKTISAEQQKDKKILQPRNKKTEEELISRRKELRLPPRELKTGRDKEGRDYERRRAWRAAHKDEINAAFREYYQKWKNTDAAKAKRRRQVEQRREFNKTERGKEKKRIANALYYMRHRDDKRARKRKGKNL